MEREEFIAYCELYVSTVRFTPIEGSIPNARIKDLEKLTEMAKNLPSNILKEITKNTAAVICSSYYLGKQNP